MIDRINEKINQEYQKNPSLFNLKLLLLSSLLLFFYFINKRKLITETEFFKIINSSEIEKVTLNTSGSDFSSKSGVIIFRD